MTSTRIHARPASRWMGLICAALAAAPGLAHARGADLFFERTVMTAADERCGLFAPEVASALAAGRVQARGAALRAGVSPDTLKGLERGAWAKASRLDCASPQLLREAERVKSAFAGFLNYTRVSYRGDMAGWKADRNGGRRTRWRLVQDAAFGPDRLSFGLAGLESPGVLLAVARFDDGATPYSARLILRDSERTLGPYLSRQGGEAMQMIPLHRRLPPGAGVKFFMAEARSPAGADLLPKDAKGGWAFRFPASAVRELSGLDPREAVAVEFLFADNRRPVRRAYVEVGDFAAGHAFLQLAAVERVSRGTGGGR
ncbi:hypothetical protein [Phenylobacterium sp.]|uniref:hypothetical protein n=1 Tax=Phenylobacterium sp. TaxID=1871053 RepID=UPI002F92FAF0